MIHLTYILDDDQWNRLRADTIIRHIKPSAIPIEDREVAEMAVPFEFKKCQALPPPNQLVILTEYYEATNTSMLRNIQFCCEEMLDMLMSSQPINERTFILNRYDGDITLDGFTVRYCPFCGAEIVAKEEVLT